MVDGSSACCILAGVEPPSCMQPLCLYAGHPTAARSSPRSCRKLALACHAFCRPSRQLSAVHSYSRTRLGTSSLEYRSIPVLLGVQAPGQLSAAAMSQVGPFCVLVSCVAWEPRQTRRVPRCRTRSPSTEKAIGSTDPLESSGGWGFSLFANQIN